MNDRHPMGNVAEAPLQEIWRGARARALRRAMERGDLGLGCDVCATQVDAGRPDLAYARWFEAFPVAKADPDWPRQLELSLTNTCNLRCVMCNGEWSSSIRTRVEGRAPLPAVYGEAFFAQLRPFLPHLERVKFYGGEPFLAAETLRVMELLVEEGLSTRCHVTTNATQWTPRVERILTMLPVDVSVSLDAATPQTYESIRRGSSWDTVRRNLDRFCEWADRRGTWVSVTFCLMTVNWHELRDFFALADALGVEGTVNEVSEPAHLSLLHLDLAQLDAVVTTLEQQDGAGVALDLNRRPWMDVLATLRRRAADAEVHERLTGAYAATARAVAEGRPAAGAAAAVLTRADASRSARTVRDRVVADCRRHVTVDSVRIDLDPTGRVCATEDLSVLELPADAVVGRHHRELANVVGERLGPVVHIDHRLVAERVEVSAVHLADGRRLDVFATPALDDAPEAVSLYFSWGTP